MTPKQIREKLKQQGETYRSIARKHGYKEQYVAKAIRRWAGATRGFPGGKAYHICLQVSLLIGNPINDLIKDEIALRLKESKT